MLKIIRAIISNFDDIIKMEDFDLNPIQDGGRGRGRGTKRPLSTSFSSVTSTNVGFRPKNF